MVNSLAPEELKVRKVETAEVNPSDLEEFVCHVAEDGDCDDEGEEYNYLEDEEEDIIYDIVDNYYPGQDTENPEKPEAPLDIVIRLAGGENELSNSD